MNRKKLRELVTTLRGEMARGISAQRLAILTADAFESVLEHDLDEVRAYTMQRDLIGHASNNRHLEALMRETAVWLLDDLERQPLSREQKLAHITTRVRDIVRFARTLT